MLLLLEVGTRCPSADDKVFLDYSTMSHSYDLNFLNAKLGIANL